MPTKRLWGKFSHYKQFLQSHFAVRPLQSPRLTTLKGPHGSEGFCYLGGRYDLRLRRSEGIFPMPVPGSCSP